MAASPRPPKAKITVTLSLDVVRQLDALLEQLAARSRSQLVEEVLRRWLKERSHRDLESETEAYYRSLSPAEQEENKEWSTIAAQGASRIWDE